ncbi:cytochrome c oxidase subunit 7B2 [Prionailurus iriomotensis]
MGSLQGDLAPNCSKSAATVAPFCLQLQDVSYGQKRFQSSPRVQSIQQTMARQSHQKRTPDFHDKYGNAVLASGATFCVAVWAYTATQIGIEWNLSPVGRVTPKEWRDQ